MQARYESGHIFLGFPPHSMGAPSLRLLPDFSVAQTLDVGGRGERKEAQISKASQVNGIKSWKPATEPPPTPDKAMGSRLHPEGPPRCNVKGNCHSQNVPQEMKAESVATSGLTLQEHMHS